jgi:squalene-associated FAD-dependent desaturase
MSIAVIGGGYAGMAAAVELVSHGQRVEIFEASRTLGGRARAVDIDGYTIDNGQHILLGAYSETLRLMQLVGADPQRLLKRLPLRLEFPGEMRLVAPHLPAPLHSLAAILFASGLGWREKFAALRLMRTLQLAKFRIVPDVTVTQWLEQHKTPSRQRRLLWEPLCVAALNTPAEHASAQVLANVIRDSLAAAREASDLLLPQVDLSAMFPEPAAQFITQHGGSIHRGQRVTELQRTGQGWRINGQGPFKQVVLAVAAYHLTALAPELRTAVEHFTWEPIVTSYFTYPAHVRLPQPMLGIAAGTAQWLFDRGQLGGPAGLIAAVISARGRHLDLPAAELERRIHAEIANIVPQLPAPQHTQTITEKRATFSCTPNLPRPGMQTGAPGLWLAGDYVGSALPAVASDYPATIEGAVRSGVNAARAAIA